MIKIKFVRSYNSLISSGTEKMLLEFGKSNLISKVLKEPEKAKLVLSKIAKDGIFSTYDSENNKLKKPIPIGMQCWKNWIFSF